MSTTLLILAAGMGSRYGGLKQLDPFGPSGESLMEYSINDAVKAGFDKVVFVIRSDFEQAFREQFLSKLEDQVRTDYVFQELNDLPAGFSAPPDRVKPWGTSHAVLVAQPVIREPFAVLNADDFYGRDAITRVYEFLNTKSSGDQQCHAIVGYPISKTLSDFGSVSRAVLETDQNGYLKAIKERTKIFRRKNGTVEYEEEGATVRLTGAESVSMNLIGFQPSVFAPLEEYFVDFLEQSSGDPKAEFFLPTLMENLVRSGKARVKILDTESEWFGVTYSEDKEQVRRRIQQLVDSGVYPVSGLWK